MNVQSNKWIFVFPVLALLSFTSSTSDLKNFCNYFEVEQLDSCKSVLNDYFKAKQQKPLQHKKYYERFPELDTLITELSKLPCVDTCFFRYSKGFVTKTNPPGTDIFIYRINSTDTAKYLLSVLFYEPMTIVGLHKWEY